jgi:hypothetical protein
MSDWEETGAAHASRLGREGRCGLRPDDCRPKVWKTDHDRIFAVSSRLPSEFNHESLSDLSRLPQTVVISVHTADATRTRYSTVS